MVAGLLDWHRRSGDLIGSVCGVACLGMIAVMLFRFRLYSTHTGHHAHSE
jgi:hypothetical protein